MRHDEDDLMMKCALLYLFGAALLLAAVGYTVFEVSPWPSALLVRRFFDRTGIETSRALEKHVPAGVAAVLNMRYDGFEVDAVLDAFYPAVVRGTGKILPTIVWVHGGGFLSGSKDLIANYLKILAGKGFVVIGVNYSLAPGKTYPTPVRQVNAALAFIVENAEQLHADSSKFFLAGDSTGSQIVGQMANMISRQAYASEVGIAPSITRSQLRGVILFCGAYEPENLIYRRTVLWSYFGRKDFWRDPRLAQFPVAGQITAEFPAIFISAGNNDPFLSESHNLAETAVRRGVMVDSLFFPNNYSPPLPHEYQFNLDNEAGRLALARMVSFISSRLQ